MAYMTRPEQTGPDALGQKTTCLVCHGSGEVDGAYCACPAGSRVQQAESASSKPDDKPDGD